MAGLTASKSWLYAKYAVYGSSKAAMNMYTFHLAYELRDTAFKVNAVCPGYTKTDFTNYDGGEVEEAGKRIVKWVLIDQNGPTGKFFSEESNPQKAKFHGNKGRNMLRKTPITYFCKAS